MNKVNNILNLSTLTVTLLSFGKKYLWDLGYNSKMLQIRNIFHSLPLFSQPNVKLIFYGNILNAFCFENLLCFTAP